MHFGADYLVGLKEQVNQNQKKEKEKKMFKVIVSIVISAAGIWSVMKSCQVIGNSFPRWMWITAFVLLSIGLFLT